MATEILDEDLEKRKKDIRGRYSGGRDNKRVSNDRFKRRSDGNDRRRDFRRRGTD